MGRNLTVKRDTIVKLLLLITIMAIFSLFFLDGVNFSFSICLLIWLFVVWRASVDIEKNIVFICFCLSMFVFLIAAPYAELIIGFMGTNRFTESARIHFYRTLIMSFIGIYVGYFGLYDKVVFKYTLKKTNYNIRKRLKRISFLFFLFTYGIKFLQYCEIALNTLIHGYIYYYTDYSSFIPSVVIKLSDMYIVALAIFLACMPEKNEVKRILTIYVAGAAVVGVGGRRYDFIIAIVVSIIYLIMRNRSDENGEEWISKKQVVMIIASVPLMILLLMVIGASRSKQVYNFSSLRITILEFMTDIGNSGKVVMRAYENKDKIPTGRFYSFGSLIEYFKYNKISKVVFGIVEPNARTAEYALNGHSLAYMVTYLFSKANFFSGHGQGSCYIAELYADFGYIGVVIGNIVLGRFIKIFGYMKSDTVLRDSICIMIIPTIIHMPRDTYCLPLTYIINYKYIAAYLIIYILAYNKKSISNKD